MKKLPAAQTKSITNAKDQVKAAANVMIETPLELIKCILLKHETAVIEVMKELHDEKIRLQQQRDDLLAAINKFLSDNNLEGFGCACEPNRLCGPCSEAKRQAPLYAAIAKVKP